METIGIKIKRLRDKKKWTQQDLADKIGVSYTTVSLYESDARKPSFKALSRIAEAFDVTLAFFLNGDFDQINVDEDTKMAARNFQQLNKEDRIIINEIMKSLINKAKNGD